MGSETALQQVVEGVTDCRFEATDSTRDEVVIIKIVQLHLALMRSRARRLLSEEKLWSLVESAFRLHQQVWLAGSRRRGGQR
jgi:hypothetical protein